MDHHVPIEDKEYLRQRLEPRPGDLDYIHLADLLRALESIGTDEALIILDYGCGGSPYRSLFPNADYRRADFAEVSDLDYVIGEGSKIDAEDASFDLIISTQVAEHVRDPASYFRESYRLLRAGGKFVCTTHGTYPDHACPDDYQRWTAEGLTRDLQAAGFTISGIKKITTNARALMYFMQRFSGWFDPASGLPWSVLFRFYRSVQHRRPKTWHKMADKFFPGNKIVDASKNGHDVYIGLMAIATKD
jgi:SAM-dependent methyltransferase